jgi:response regulator RpfG family c-di-GMP phosphodiesterase
LDTDLDSETGRAARLTSALLRQADDRDAEPWRVLLVDGDPRAQRFASGVLRLDGHEVAGFEQAEPALTEAWRLAPDLVVLDLISLTRWNRR